MNKQTEVKRLVNPNIKAGDSVYIRDGSGLRIKEEGKEYGEVYITKPYLHLTGKGLRLKDIKGTVIKIGIKGIYSKQKHKFLNTCYEYDVVIKLGNTQFYTCSEFLLKITQT